MISKIMANNRTVERKICYDCWYYVSGPTPNKIFDDPEYRKKFSHCEFNNDFPSVKPDDMCENWESKRLKLISVIKSLYGL